MEIATTSRAAVPVTVRTPFCTRAVAPVAALAGAADAPSTPAIAAVTATLAARRMRVFICFLHICTSRARYQDHRVRPGPAVELAPGGLRVRDLGETANVSRPAECSVFGRFVVRAVVPAAFTG